MKRPHTLPPTAGAGVLGRGRALGRWVALVASVTVLAAPFVRPAAGAAALCSEPGRIVERVKQWQTITPPAFSKGGRTLVDYAVAPHKPSLIFVSNGAVVARSTDGGCRWKEALVPQATPLGGPISIRSIAIPEAASAQGTVLVMAEEKVGNVGRPRVWRSSNSGASFQQADAGLPPAGDPHSLRIAPSTPSTAYLALSQGGDVIDTLFATTDGGTTWTLRSDAADLAKQQNISGFEIDPADATQLWAWGPNGAYHSNDGGRTFTAIDEFAGQLAGPGDVHHQKGKPARVLFFRPGVGMLVSLDGGQRFLALDAPAGVDSIAHGTGPMDLALTNEDAESKRHVYLYLPSANAWVDLRAPGPAADVTIGRTNSTDVWVRTDTTIEHFVGSPPPPPPKPPKGGTVFVPSIDKLDEIIDEPAHLTGPTQTLKLKPGTSRTLTYMLDLPRGDRPLDLFFLIDTTGTMKNFIDELKLGIADIVNGLADAGIAADVGLGEYRAYPDATPPRTNEPNFVYRKLVELGNNPEALRTALQGLEHDGGGQYDAQAGALYQVATGEGQDLAPQDGSEENTIGHDVPKGQNPKFRIDADGLRLVLNVSNEPFGRPNPNRGGITDPSDRGLLAPPDIPSIDEVSTALNARGIKQVGLAIGNAPGTYEDLAAVAEKTLTFAPAEGVDCDGDGVADLAPNSPLVCRLAAGGEGAAAIVPAIVNLVKSLPPRETPRMEIPRGADVVEDVTPDSYNQIALDAGKSLPFRVTYSCSKEQAGKKFPVLLQTHGGEGLLAELRTAVACAELPVKGKDPKKEEKVTPPPPPALFVPGVLVPLLPPIAPPSAPIPISEISSATSSQAQTQAQAQAQAAAAAQRQHQPQLAFAHARKAKVELAKEEEYEMSAFNRREPHMPPSPALVAAAAAMTFAFGMAMRRKGAPHVVRSRRRRR